jgi:hypothetical protein
MVNQMELMRGGTSGTTLADASALGNLCEGVAFM